MAGQLLLLGLGNDILSDDAIGLNIVRALCGHLSPEDGIDVIEADETGLALLDRIVGYTDLVLVDAVQTGKAPIGHLHELDADDLQVVPGMSPHFLGCGELLALGRQLELAMPQRVRILAVEVEDPFTVNTQMTPALQAAFPGLVERVRCALLALVPAHSP